MGTSTSSSFKGWAKTTHISSQDRYARKATPQPLDRDSSSLTDKRGIEDRRTSNSTYNFNFEEPHQCLDTLVLADNTKHIAAHRTPGCPTQSGTSRTIHATQFKDDEGRDNQGSLSTETTRFSTTEGFPSSGTSPLDRSYTDGEPRVLMTSDGVKQCLAMLLSDYLATDVDSLIRSKKALACQQSRMDSAEAEAGSIEMRIDTLINIELISAESQEEKEQIQRYIEQSEAELKSAAKRRDRLKEELDPFQISFDTSVEFLQDTLEKILRPAGLLDPVEEDSDSTSCNNENSQEESTRPTSVQSIEPSAEQLLGLAAQEELQQAQWKMAEAQGNFDRRQIEYRRRLADFEGLAAEAKVGSRSDFDRRQLQREQGLTRKLINAENSYKLLNKQGSYH